MFAKKQKIEKSIICFNHSISVLPLFCFVFFTFCLLAKEALGHFSKKFLGRTGWVELWHCQAAAGRKLIRSVALEEKVKRRHQGEGHIHCI